MSRKALTRAYTAVHALQSVLHVLGGTLTCGQRRVMSLDEMFAIADSLNSTIKVSNLAVSEAEAGEGVARNAYLPSVEASVSASYNGDGYIMDRKFKNGFGVNIPSFGNNFKLEVNQVIFGYLESFLTFLMQYAMMVSAIHVSMADSNIIIYFC